MKKKERKDDGEEEEEEEEGWYSIEQLQVTRDNLMLRLGNEKRMS